MRVGIKVCERCARCLDWGTDCFCIWVREGTPIVLYRAGVDANSPTLCHTGKNRNDID